MGTQRVDMTVWTELNWYLKIYICPLKLFQNTEEEVTLSNLFYKTALPWYQNSDKNTNRKWNYRPVLWMNTDIRPPDLPLKKPVCRSGSNSWNWTWNNRLVPNRKRSTSRLYIVTLLIYPYAEYIMRNTGLDEAQAGIRIAGRNINNLRYADDTTLMAESE